MVVVFQSTPAPLPADHQCSTCGAPVASYDVFCDRHREVGVLYRKPLLIDRIMDRILGRRRPERP